MTAVEPAAGVTFEAVAPVLVVGGGACGLVAALAAREAGARVLVLERDPVATGGTALSAGLIPAAGTRAQREKGVADGPVRFAADIQARAKGRADPRLVQTVARDAGPTVDWLRDAHGVPLELLDGFLDPGHTIHRMHGTPRRTGTELLGFLAAAAERAGIEVMNDARVTTLFADPDGRVRGVGLGRPDGGAVAAERIGCEALVLACGGFGGDPELVAEHVPEMAGVPYLGHPGDQGDAVRWGVALGALPRDMGAYRGHGSVAHPEGIPIPWACVTEGGFQVNARGRRFADEGRGHSEQAAEVLRQPGGVAWTVFDERIAAVARRFQGFRDAEAAGLVLRAATASDLARAAGLPAAALAATCAEVATLARSGHADRFGRRFAVPGLPPLRPPLLAVRVTGALLHTQGGLAVDERARVLRAADGRPLPNLFAGGGAACGISGPAADGYLAGNGLATAVVLGRLAGATAAAMVAQPEARRSPSSQRPSRRSTPVPSHVAANGISFNYRFDGPPNRPVVMLSNSLMSDLSMWEPQMEALTERFRVLRYDTRGHGGTDAPAGPYTIELLASDAVALLDALGLERVHFVGLSLGGMTGQFLGARRPERLLGLVLCDTASHMPAPEMWDGRIRTAETQGLEALIPATLERWFTAPFREAHKDVIGRIEAMIRRTPVAGYVGCCHAIRDMNQTDLLADIGAPTLVIVGADDPSTPVAAARAIHERIPGSELTVIADAAHLPNVERPGAFNAALLAFLERIERGG